MKKFTFLAAIAVVLTVFNGCTKDKDIPNNDLPEFVSSEYVSLYGKYSKELLVFDASKENSILIVCHSESEDALNQYLSTTDLMLNINNSTVDLEFKSAKLSQPDSLKKSGIPQDMEKRMVSIDLTTANLKSGVKGYSLSVKSKTNLLKSVGPGFIFGSNAFYTSEYHGNFIGVWHYGNGWGEDMYDCYTKHKVTDCMLCSWTTLSEGLIEESYPYWGAIDYRQESKLYGYNPYYKLGIQVYNDSRATTRNYEIAYSVSQFYSQNCTIGSYDSRNCYVGTAPTGTNAFIWSNKFYYSPINGNQCPLPGSSFDSVNCYVRAIPSNCTGFTSGNSWFVKPDLILD